MLENLEETISLKNLPEIKRKQSFWQVMNEQDASFQWDNLLILQKDYSIFQSFLWGQHKKNMGDKVLRLIFWDNNGKAETLLQIFFKKLPFNIFLGWSPGGASGNLIRIKSDLLEILKGELGARFVYLRFSFHRKENESDRQILLANNLKKSKYNIAGELSMSYYPNATLDVLSANLKGNWRHNLKRGEKQNLIISNSADFDIQSVIRLYRSLEKIKNISKQYSDKELESILEVFKDKMTIYFASSSDGELLALRACVILGSFAFDFLAATNDNGRKKYASYLLFWEIAKHCQKHHIAHYNMMGIDPVKNPGVYNFKQGTGAHL